LRTGVIEFGTLLLNKEKSYFGSFRDVLEQNNTSSVTKGHLNILRVAVLSRKSNIFHVN
jgi:hypothetical protein